MKENNIKNFVYKNWHWLAFFILAFLSLSFLIFQPGVWAFTDSGFYYQNVLQAKSIAWSKLGQFANTDGFYFGFDNSAAAFSQLIVSFYQAALTSAFGVYLGQILFYFIYYLLTFYFGGQLLKKLFSGADDFAIGVGALFLTFNPFSLLIVTLFNISYIYPSAIIFLLKFLQYLEKGKIRNLTAAVFFGIYLLSYFRLIPIIAFLIISVLWLFYKKDYFVSHRWLIFIATVAVCASPFIISNLPLINHSDNIFSNYQSAFSQYDFANYNFKKSFINAFSYPGGFTPSALSFFYNNRGLPGFADNFAVQSSFEFYKTLQVIFNVSILLFALFFFRNRKVLKIVWLICVIFLINALGLFSSAFVFLELHKTLLFFLYNDYGFFQFAQSFFYTFLIVSLIGLIKNSGRPRKILVIFSVAVGAYIVINMAPLLSNYYGLKKINNIPHNYQQSFFSNSSYEFREAVIFAPYHWLKFQWSPYYLDLNSFYSQYQSLIVPNLRLINDDFVKFYNQIYDNFSRKEVSNVSIFNVKDIFLFHDVANANSEIDTYLVTDLEYKAQKNDSDLKKLNNLVVAKNNENFTQYRLKDADNYDFFIYSPKNLLNVDLNNFYDESFDLSQKPVLFKKNELNQVNALADVNFFLNSPYVSYKASPNNSNKYYVKLNVMKNQPFLLQFNQMYSDSWRVYFVSKAEWDAVACRQNWQNFSMSQNSRCSYQGSALDLSDFKLLTESYLKQENHFLGNIIGNSYLITPQDIPVQYRDGNDLYLVIYFNKQIYYLISLIAAGLTFTGLMILSLFEIIWFAKKQLKP